MVAALGAPHVADLTPARHGPSGSGRLLLLVSGGVFASVALLAVAHVADTYQMDHVSGARMALAWYADHGTLYPPLFDGEAFGGTRFMPLPVVAHTLVAKLTGEYLVSGHLLAGLTMIALLLAVWVLLRRRSCPTPLATALCALILATQVGLQAAIGGRGDTLPALLQLLAVGAVARASDRRATTAAGILSALALLAKITALWAPLAIVVWLAFRDRPAARRFALTFLASAAALFVLFVVASDGRFVDNVFGLSTAGVDSVREVVKSPHRLLLLLVQEAPALWLVLPVAGTAVWLAFRTRTITLYQLSFLFSLVLLIGVLGDIGTGGNQLVDLAVLTVLVAGEAVGNEAWPQWRPLFQTALVVAVLWGVLTGWATTVAPDLPQAVSSLRGRGTYTAEPLRGLVTPSTRLLSEDPYLAVSRDRRPVVLDAFMLTRVGRKDPAALRSLVDRIDAQQFDVVALLVPLEPIDQEWWRRYDFGPAVVAAISRNYVFHAKADGYYTYLPRRSGATG